MSQHHPNESTFKSRQMASATPITASSLDFFSEASSITNSEYKGFALLICLVGFMYLILNPLILWYDKQQILDLSLASGMFIDFHLLVFMWFKLFLWSFTAYGLHKLYIKKKFSNFTYHILQHLTQATSIFYAFLCCYYSRWAVIPTGFILMLAFSFFMKMHSYTEANRKYFDDLNTKECNAIYPKNVTLLNFVDFLFVPVFVYDVEYPRGNGFRLKYFIWKLASLIISMILLYNIISSWLIPTIVRVPLMSLVEAHARMMLPLIIAVVLLFFITFECICNLLAEVTNFGDREFYSDWWNSTTFDEFSRKWNRPVHTFLLKHVYKMQQEKYQLSQSIASAGTFLFSACAHEVILALCFRSLKFYLFTLMLIQLPLIYIGRRVKGSMIGNLMFWCALMIGFPILTIAYSRDWAISHYQHLYEADLRIRIF